MSAIRTHQCRRSFPRLASAAALLASLLAACAVDETEPLPAEIASAAEGLNLVAFVRTPTGGTLEFYEPQPGQLLISGSERAGVTAVTHDLDLGRATLDEIYAVAAPGLVAPPELVAAYARAARQPAASRPETLAPSAEAPVAALERGRADGLDGSAALGGATVAAAVDDSACPAEWFQEQHCGEWCWLQKTGSSSHYASDVTWGHGAACSYRGNITFAAKYRTWYSWSDTSSWTVLEGHARWWERSNLTDFDMRTSVSDADGNGYHHGGWVIN